MTTGNDNWVCFTCRVVMRLPKTDKRVPKCLGCGLDTFWLGSKVEAPKKDDIRGWRKLKDDCQARHIARIEKEAADRRRNIQATKLRIEQLESLPVNKDRTKLISQIRKGLEGLL